MSIQELISCSQNHIKIYTLGWFREQTRLYLPSCITIPMVICVLCANYLIDDDIFDIIGEDLTVNFNKKRIKYDYKNILNQFTSGMSTKYLAYGSQKIKENDNNTYIWDIKLLRFNNMKQRNSYIIVGIVGVNETIKQGDTHHFYTDSFGNFIYRSSFDENYANSQRKAKYYILQHHFDYGYAQKKVLALNEAPYVKYKQDDTIQIKFNAHKNILTFFKNYQNEKIYNLYNEMVGSIKYLGIQYYSLVVGIKSWKSNDVELKIVNFAKIKS